MADFSARGEVITQGPLRVALLVSVVRAAMERESQQCTSASISLSPLLSFVLKTLFSLSFGARGAEPVLAVEAEKALPCYFTKRVVVTHRPAPRITQCFISLSLYERIK